MTGAPSKRGWPRGNTLILGGGILSLVAGVVVLAALGGVVATVAGIILVGLGGIVLVSLVFLVIGQGEDRDRMQHPRG
jgi:ABC-type uncharacterized transport system permease subunit